MMEKSKNTFKYDEDNDTLEIIEINGKAPMHKEVYRKMQSSSKPTIKQSSLAERVQGTYARKGLSLTAGGGGR